LINEISNPCDCQGNRCNNNIFHFASLSIARADAARRMPAVDTKYLGTAKNFINHGM